MTNKKPTPTPSPSERLESLLVKRSMVSELGNIATVSKFTHTPKLSARKNQIQRSFRKDSTSIENLITKYHHTKNPELLARLDETILRELGSSGLSQKDLVGLYGATAAAYDEDSSALKLIAKAIDNAPAKEVQPKNKKQNTAKNQEEKPKPDIATIESWLNPEKPRSSISVNDEALVDLMLYPEEGAMFLYSKLVGDEMTTRQNKWDPTEQKNAQLGVRKLFETALFPLTFNNPGVKGARDGLKRLLTVPEYQKKLEALNQYGRNLEYQGVNDLDTLNKTGGFLLFGLNNSYSKAPDKLPMTARVVITPKIDCIGEVAAELIDKIRLKGVEPHGKIWDESTSNSGISPRTDRLLFYAKTEGHLKAIYEALKELQQEKLEMFEENPPILYQKTDIPGVGLAEEPKQNPGGFKDSFTGSRELLISTAWENTLDQIVGIKGKKQFSAYNGSLIDTRIASLRKAFEAGTVPKDKIIDTFKKNIRLLSPKFGVSPDNFAKNL